jgi:hypothetical protein
MILDTAIPGDEQDGAKWQQISTGIFCRECLISDRLGWQDPTVTTIPKMFHVEHC